MFLLWYQSATPVPTWQPLCRDTSLPRLIAITTHLHARVMLPLRITMGDRIRGFDGEILFTTKVEGASGALTRHQLPGDHTSPCVS